MTNKEIIALESLLNSDVNILHSNHLDGLSVLKNLFDKHRKEKECAFYSAPIMIEHYFRFNPKMEQAVNVALDYFKKHYSREIEYLENCERNKYLYFINNAPERLQGILRMSLMLFNTEKPLDVFFAYCPETFLPMDVCRRLIDYLRYLTKENAQLILYTESPLLASKYMDKAIDLDTLI